MPSPYIVYFTYLLRVADFEAMLRRHLQHLLPHLMTVVMLKMKMTYSMCPYQTLSNKLTQTPTFTYHLSWDVLLIPWTLLPQQMLTRQWQTNRILEFSMAHLQSVRLCGIPFTEAQRLQILWKNSAVAKWLFVHALLVGILNLMPWVGFWSWQTSCLQSVMHWIFHVCRRAGFPEGLSSCHATCSSNPWFITRWLKLLLWNAVTETCTAAKQTEVSRNRKRK